MNKKTKIYEIFDTIRLIVVVIIILSPFIFIGGIKFFGLYFFDIGYTNTYVKKKTISQSGEDNMIYLTYKIGESTYERYFYLDTAYNLSAGQNLNCIFYSKFLPFVSRFDLYLFENPEKRDEIMKLRVDEKSFVNSIKTYSIIDGIP